MQERVHLQDQIAAKNFFSTLMGSKVRCQCKIRLIYWIRDVAKFC